MSQKYFNFVIITLLSISIVIMGINSVSSIETSSYQNCGKNFPDPEFAYFDNFLRTCIDIRNDFLVLDLKYWHKETGRSDFYFMEYYISYSVAYQINTSDFFSNSSTLDDQIIYESEYPIGSENSDFQELKIIDLSSVSYSYLSANVTFHYHLNGSQEIKYQDYISLGLEVGERIEDPVHPKIVLFDFLILLLLIFSFILYIYLFLSPVLLDDILRVIRTITDQKNIPISSKAEYYLQNKKMTIFIIIFHLYYIYSGLIFMIMTGDLVLKASLIIYNIFLLIAFEFLFLFGILVAIEKNVLISDKENFPKLVVSVRNFFKTYLIKVRCNIHKKKLLKEHKEYCRQRIESKFPKKYHYKKSYQLMKEIDQNLENLNRLEDEYTQLQSQKLVLSKEMKKNTKILKKKAQNLELTKFLVENFVYHYTIIILKNQAPEFILPVDSRRILTNIYESLSNKRNTDELLQQILLIEKEEFERSINIIYTFIHNSKNDQNKKKIPPINKKDLVSLTMWANDIKTLHHAMLDLEEKIRRISNKKIILNREILEKEEEKEKNMNMTLSFSNNYFDFLNKWLARFRDELLFIDKNSIEDIRYIIKEIHDITRERIYTADCIRYKQR